jgi:hypothetical protein
MGIVCKKNMGGRGMYLLLVRNPEGKRLLASPRCRWMNNIEADLDRPISITNYMTPCISRP